MKTVELPVRMARTRNGLAALDVGRLVTAPSTVAYIHAKRTVILKSHSLHTVRDHQMLFLTAPVARPRCLRFPDTLLGPPAKIQS